MTADVAPPWPEKPTLASHQARFEAQIAGHRRIVFKVANAYVRAPEDRRDLAQEIVTQAWRAFPRFDPARKFSTWLYRIALNVAISARRGDLVRAKYAAPAAAPALESLPGAPDREADDRLRELYRVID